jgi:hypothetical protein
MIRFTVSRRMKAHDQNKSEEAWTSLHAHLKYQGVKEGAAEIGLFSLSTASPNNAATSRGN